MPRKVRDAILDSRTARRRLRSRGKPYYRGLEPGLHLGYRRPAGVDASGKWVARYYVGERTYLTETLAVADDMSDANGINVLSYAQAMGLARARMAERARDSAGIAKPLTVKVIIDTYIEFLFANRKSGREAKYASEAFILPMLGSYEVSRLTTEMLRKWHMGVKNAPARIRSKPGTPQKFKSEEGDPERDRRRRSTANRILTILKGALNMAWREGKIESDAVWRRVEPFEGADSARVRYLTMDEAHRLLRVCDASFGILVRGALETGARYGELCRVLVCDFNEDSGTLAVRVSKGGKPRHIILTAAGAQFFQGLTRGRAASDLMFLKDNGESWRASHQAEPIAKANTKAGICPPINFHGLRHTWASHAVMNGIPLMIVAKNLGHSDTRMVEKHYGHLTQSYIAGEIRGKAPKFAPSDSASAGVSL